MMTAQAHPHLLDSLPPLRGRVQADAALGPTTWFRVGGPAEVLVRPADVDERLRQLPDQRRVERVAPVRPRQRDPQDGAVTLDLEIRHVA